MGRRKAGNEEVIGELKRLKNECPFMIERMLLFGSRARGDHLLDSDADVLVVSPEFRGMKFHERPSWFLGNWRLPIDLELICLTPEEFEEKKKMIGIVRQAVEEGIDL